MHAWDLTPAKAVALQRALVQKVRQEPLSQPVRHVAGVDVSIRGGLAHAAVVVLSIPDLVCTDQATHSGPIPYPYVPGLLAFRELPPILSALRKLTQPFDVVMVDGHGRVHPRRFGLACHLGTALDVAAVGVAKRPYIGSFEALGTAKGSRAVLEHADSGEVLGMAVRTRSAVQPVYVSVGHRITLQEAVHLVLATAPRYRIPEPTRQAHLLSRRTQLRQ